MVFYYKTITESPRCRHSPRKKKTTCRTTVPELLCLYNEDETELGPVPEREWRLLAALAKKRSDEDERRRLADHYRSMWLQEKEGREKLEAESSVQYRRFIDQKRDKERYYHDHRRMLKDLEEQAVQEQLMKSIRRKELKTRKLLACRADTMSSYLCSKAWEDEARAFLAAERRALQEAAAEWKKLAKVEETKRKCEEADKKRNNILREYSSRLQTSNILNSWDTSLHRDEIAASDEAQRAQYAMLSSLAHEKGVRVARARELLARRARAMAAQCELWRDQIKRSTC